MRRQPRIADGVLDVPMAETFLNRARINALVGEVVPSTVTEHMRMRGESDAGFVPRATDDVSNCTRRHL